MTTAPHAADNAEVTEVDTSARCALLLLLAFAVLWLVVSGVLALVNLVQLHTPALLADCSLLTELLSKVLHKI